MSFSLLALWLLGRKNRLGFVSFMIANTCWLFVGWLAPSIAIVIGNVVFFAANLCGYHQWKTTAPSR